MCLYPFFHRFYFTAEFLFAGLYPTTEKLSLPIHSAIKRETKKVKGIWFSLSSCFSVVPGKPPEFQYLRFFFCQFQPIFSKAFFQSLLKYFCFILVLETADKIITVSDKITFSSALSFHDYIKPVIQHIVQIYIGKYRTYSISLWGSTFAVEIFAILYDFKKSPVCYSSNSLLPVLWLPCPLPEDVLQWCPAEA